MLCVVSANVNGVRAALRRGGLDWLAAADADVLCLQEVRADDAQLMAVLAQGGLGEYATASAASSQAGRCGVAVLTRQAPSAVRRDLPGFADSGRWIEVDVDVAGAALTAVSAYVHTGEAGTPKQDEKFAFLDAVTARLAELAVSGRHVVVTGDLNIAHRKADLRNWKGNLGRAGFLPEEQAYFDRWAGAGWVDLGRAHAGDVDGPYTWWSWRGKAFDNDTGWRIDYQWATGELARAVTKVEVGRAASYAERWSDHAPVTSWFDLG